MKLLAERRLGKLALIGIFVVVFGLLSNTAWTALQESESDETEAARVPAALTVIRLARWSWYPSRSIRPRPRSTKPTAPS